MRGNSFSSIDEEAQDASSVLRLHSPPDDNDAISVASVESVDQRGKVRSKSRLSLNLISDRAPSPSKSPNFIPKFLRNSFSKLMGSRKGSPTPSGPNTPSVNDANKDIAADNVINANSTSAILNLAVQSFQRSASATFPQDLPPMPCSYAELQAANSTSPPEEVFPGALPDSPTVLQYLEEAKMSGMPLIPFAHPTAVVAEKLRKKKQKMSSSDEATTVKTKNPSGDSCKSNRSDPIDIEGPPALRSLDNEEEKEAEEVNYPHSLDNLVEIAHQEFLSESISIRDGWDEKALYEAISKAKREQTASRSSTSPSLKPQITSSPVNILQKPPSSVGLSDEEPKSLEDLKEIANRELMMEKGFASCKSGCSCDSGGSFLAEESFNNNQFEMDAAAVQHELEASSGFRHSAKNVVSGELMRTGR